MSETKFLTAVLKEKFEEARTIVNKGWTKIGYAIDDNHYICDVRSPNARCWCLTGALVLVSHAKYEDYSLKRVVPNDLLVILVRIFREVTDIYNLIEFNDYTSKDKRYVLRKLDKVIKWLDDYEREWFTPPSTWSMYYA